MALEDRLRRAQQPSLEERLTRAQMVPGVPQTTIATASRGPSSTARSAGWRSLSERFVGNLANIPNTALTLAMNVPSIRAMLPPDQVMRIPEVGERVLPTPTGQQIIAGAETAIESAAPLLGGKPVDLSASFGRNLADAEALAAEHPLATQIGEFAGDAATLATGRVPIRSALRKRAPKPDDADLKKAIDDQVVDFGKSIGKGIGRAAETGLEGATLALLSEGDPAEMAMYAAGGQAAGSAMLSSFSAARKHPGKAFVSLWMGSQVWKALGPGQRDVFEASDNALNGLIGAYALGIGAGAIGASRVPIGAFRRNFVDSMAEAVNSGARGGSLSVLKEFIAESERGEDTLQRVVETYTSGGFNENQRKRIERAFNNGNLSSEVEKMMDIPSFRSALSE